jgi:hypothetical protein
MKPEENNSSELEGQKPAQVRDFSGTDKVYQIISDNPGIGIGEIVAQLDVSKATLYARLVKLRNQNRIKTVHEGGQAHYYPFNFALAQVPGMDEPGVPLKVGDAMVTARTLSPDQLKQLLDTPQVPTKYAEMLGYLDRINIGEAAIFNARELEPDNARSRIRTWFKDNKKFSVTVHGTHVIIERTQ